MCPAWYTASNQSLTSEEIHLQRDPSSESTRRSAHLGTRDIASHSAMADRKRSLNYLNEVVSQRLQDTTLALCLLFPLVKALSEQVAYRVSTLELAAKHAFG